MIVILVALPHLAPADKPVARMAFGIAGIILSMIFGLGILYAYKRFVGTGFVWFGIATIAGYFIGLGIYTVQNIRKMSDSNQ